MKLRNIVIIILSIFILCAVAIFSSHKGDESGSGSGSEGFDLGWSLNPKSTATPTYKDINYDASYIARDFSYNAIDASASDVTKYDSTTLNLDVQYHEDPETIAAKSGFPFGTIVVQNASGQKIYLRDPQIKGTPLYYDPTVMYYQAQTYVPNYEDAMYMSRSGSIAAASTLPAAVYGATEDVREAKFCQYKKHDRLTMERLCQTKAGVENCARYPCCVNLGGAKCVHGDARGPRFSSNYSDILVRNRDFYYHEGRCYGNCGNAK